jgi:hypothetical protein
MLRLPRYRPIWDGTLHAVRRSPEVPVGRNAKRFRPLGIETVRYVQRDIRTVSERRSDSPKVIDVLMADHQGLDLSILKEAVDAFLGKAAVHPGRIPTGIAQYSMEHAARCFRFQQGEKSSGIIRMEVAKGRPRNPIMIDCEAAGGLDVVEHLLRGVPAGFRDTENPQPIQDPDVEGRVNGGWASSSPPPGQWLPTGYGLARPSPDRPLPLDSGLHRRIP